MLELIFGIPIGLVTSLISWYYLFHSLSPKVEFSSVIQKYETSISKQIKFRFKIANVGRRNAIDLKVTARLRLPGIYASNKATTEVINVDIGSDFIPVLRPVRKYKKGTMKSLRIDRTTFFKNNINIPEYLRFEINPDLDLEYLLKNIEGSNLRIIVFAYDEFSGARKYFESKEYDYNDIKKGRFNKSSVDFIDLDEL